MTADHDYDASAEGQTDRHIFSNDIFAHLDGNTSVQNGEPSNASEGDIWIDSSR